MVEMNDDDGKEDEGNKVWYKEKLLVHEEFWKDRWTPGGGKLLEASTHSVPDHLSSDLACQYVDDNGCWNMNMFQPYLSFNSIDLIRAIPLPSSTKRNDQLPWNGSANGDFSLRSAYGFYN
ncbi:hypothetical protein JHK87_007769 [Glycine soja]|nr:hypothetical protein JHK87_007769 [Glycine soja]